MDRFEWYVGSLTDEEALILHRIVCRRAARIYEPLYRAKREAHYRTAMSINRSGAAATVGVVRP